MSLYWVQEIKNEKQDIQNSITGLKLKNGESAVITKEEQLRLVISFSDARQRRIRLIVQEGCRNLKNNLIVVSLPRPTLITGATTNI